MFDVAPTELIVLGTVALLVIPPKDLPRAMRTAGYWVGRARGVARQFRSGFDTMLRDAELAEMEQRWKAENERIMREHPATSATDAGVVGTAPGEEHGATVAAPTITDRPSPGHMTDVAAPEQPLSVEKPVVVAATVAAAPDADGKATS